MNKITQNILLSVYELAFRSGMLSFAFGWRIYCFSYRAYKNLLDRDLEVLKAYIPDGSLVLDIGANIGFSTMQLARVVGDQGSVVALEPENRNVKELRRLAARSKYAGRIIVVEAAAGDRDEKGHLELNELNPGDHRLGKSGQAINIVKIDTLVGSLENQKLSAIKMDVQGAEPLVIAGAREVIRKYRPVIFSEVFGEGLSGFGYSVADYLNILEELDYGPNTAKRGLLEHVTYDEIVRIVEANGYLDITFLPREHAS